MCDGSRLPKQKTGSPKFLICAHKEHPRDAQFLLFGSCKPDFRGFNPVSSGWFPLRFSQYWPSTSHHASCQTLGFLSTPGCLIREPFLVANPHHFGRTQAGRGTVTMNRLGIAMQRRGAVHQVELLQVPLHHLIPTGSGEKIWGKCVQINIRTHGLSPGL